MRTLTMLLVLLSLSACAGTEVRQARFEASQLAETETAFAHTMRDRDFEAFASFIAEDAVFVNGGNPLRGKAQILEHWKSYFEETEAPFSWRPDISEIGGANLGYTEGPVADPAGVVFARFYSTWKLQPEGHWLLVFDNGHRLCATPDS